jgi:STE24 endopeptidase
VRALILFFLSFSQGWAEPPPLTYELPPDQMDMAAQLHRQPNLLYFAGFAWDLGVLLLLVRTRTGARIRDAAARAAPSRFLVQAATAAGLLSILWGAGLPFMVYRHWLNLSYGLSVHPWPLWLWDALKAAVLTGVPAALLIAVVLSIAGRRPRRWWLYAWGVCVAVMIAATYAAPLIFDPLFFTFRPLAEMRPDLVRPLQDVARRGGYEVPPERIFEMDASRKTRTMNAYMTGVGASRRIVIWDTTLQALTPAQVQTVFAHELGHYALQHIPKSLAIAAAGLLLLLWMLDRILTRWAALRRWGFESLDDPAILPAAFALILLLGFFSEPLANTYSRWQERQADIYELEAMQTLTPAPGRTSAQVTQILAEIALDVPNPHPFIVFWRYSHPPTAQRMQFAQQYNPWGEGGPKFIRDMPSSGLK